MTYREISARATATWQPLPGSKSLGFYLASGQVVFSTFIGYSGANRLQRKLQAINTPKGKCPRTR